ncbi:MAG: hypothetical protein ACNA8W_01145, partial [Bradymonadaceae bacterium]
MTAVTAGLVGVLLIWAIQPIWWLGLGLLAAGLTLAALTLQDRVISLVTESKLSRFLPIAKRVGPELFCALAILLVVIFMIPHMGLLDRAVDHDHPVHFFKAWQLERYFLGEGRLWGWSNLWYAGYPAQYLYPIGADLWVIAVRWATLGLLTLEQAYGLALRLFLFLFAYGVYRFGAVGFGRPVGLLAALLILGDTAAFRFGGWVYAMQWGVWPQSLSVAFALLAMAQLPAVMKSRAWHPVALFGFFLGLALLTHPLQIMHFAIVGPVALALFAIAGPSGQWLRGASRLVMGYGLGICIGGLWVLPFLSVNDFAQSYGAPWISLHEFAAGFYNLDFLPGTWPWLIALGLVGTVGLMMRRRFHHLLTATLTLTFILVGSKDFLTTFHLLELSDSFGFVQYQRFAILLKPYLFIAAAFVIVTVVKLIARSPDGSTRRPWIVSGQVLLVSMLLLPVAVPFGIDVVERQYSRSLTPESARPYGAERAELVQWFEERFPEDPPFFRIALDVGYHEHGFADLATELPFPLYKIGFTPASIYQYKLASASEDTLIKSNVRYVLSTRRQGARHYEEAARFGRLWLYELRSWQPDPFEIIDGEGDVHLESFRDEEIILRAEPGSKGRLRLNVSYFPRWKATLDGERIDIGIEGDGEETGFMTVDLEPGTYRFYFSRGAPEYLSLILFLLGLLGIILLFRTGPQRRLDALGEWLEELEARFERLSLVAVGVVLLTILCVLVALAIWRPPLELPDDELLARIDGVAYDFGDNLSDARIGVGQGRADPCRRKWGRFSCGNQDWQD